MTVALRGDTFARLCLFCFGPTAMLDENGLTPRFVFLIRITDYKIDVQQTPQIPNKMVKELIFLERE